MDVFVIPVAQGRYELYCEQAAELVSEPSAESTGLVADLQRRFDDVLRDVEAHERREAPPEGRSLAGRMKDRLLAWFAERIAEQRLLWNLRRQTTAVAVHPQDVTFDDVLPHITRGLRRDYERHRFWLVVDAVGLIVAGILAPIPGPNLIAYYFLFRAGGHYLSMRGADQGRRRVAWTGRPCPPLDQLRDIERLDAATRQRRVLEVAAELGLRKLPTFVERVVRVKTARPPKTE